MRLEIEAATDVGLRRSQNEDHFGVWPTDAAAADADRGVLLAVADGMGGARAGEVASRLAVEAACRSWRDGRGGDPDADLAQAIEAANRAVYDESRSHAELQGMGTTLTLVSVHAGEAWLAHVGDSRAYLVRDGDIRQLTQDHSLVAQLVRDHQLTAEQARVDPRRNVVTRSVGVASHVDVDTARVAERLVPGDTLLLTTDGLHGLVEDAEMARLVASRSLREGCDDLVALARERGGPDNITVVAARVLADDGGAGGRS